MGTAMKRLAAHKGRRLAGNPELQQHLPVQRDLAHKMTTIIGQEHRVIWRHMDAVGSRILALSSRPQKVAFAVEDDHRVLTAIEDINIVVTVDADAADLLEGPPVWQLCPVGIDPIFELAAPDDH